MPFLNPSPSAGSGSYTAWTDTSSQSASPSQLDSGATTTSPSPAPTPTQSFTPAAPAPTITPTPSSSSSDKYRSIKDAEKASGLAKNEWWDFGELQKTKFEDGTDAGTTQGRTQFDYGQGHEGTLIIGKNGFIVSSDTDNNTKTGETRQFRFDAADGWKELRDGQEVSLNKNNLNENHSLLLINPDPSATDFDDQGQVKFGTLMLSVQDKANQGVASLMKLYGESSHDDITWTPKMEEGDLYASVNTNDGETNTFSEMTYYQNADANHQVQISGAGNYDGIEHDSLTALKPEGGVGNLTNRVIHNNVVETDAYRNWINFKNAVPGWLHNVFTKE